MRITIILVMSVFFSAACGSFPFATKKNKRRPTARLEMQAEQASETRQFKLFDTKTCMTNPATGLTKMEFGSGDNALKLELRGDLVTDVYTCRQANNNAASADHVGDGYDTCMVQVQVASGKDERYVNVYDIFRGTPSIGLFRYEDSCRLTIDMIDKQIKGSILCKNMAQTKFRGLPRNPVSLDDHDPEEVATFSGTFGCKVAQGTLKSEFPADPPPAEPLATAKMAWIDGEKAKRQNLSFNDAAACNFDPRSGLLEVSLTGEMQAQMDLAIRDFQRDAGSYTCEQAPNNRTDINSVGDLYDGCKVDVSFQSDDLADGSVAFAIYRESTDIKPFTYASNCTITISSVDDELMRGQLECLQMAQTIYGGLPRNPVAADDTTADVAGDLTSNFACRIQTLGETE